MKILGFGYSMIIIKANIVYIIKVTKRIFIYNRVLSKTIIDGKYMLIYFKVFSFYCIIDVIFCLMFKDKRRKYERNIISRG